MSSKFALIILGSILISCSEKERIQTNKNPLTEFSDLYSDIRTKSIFSRNVSDTFKIFEAIPRGYNRDSARKYPLIIILDANAFIESTVAELKFNSFIGLIPKSIVVGVGYKDFPTMDSLRSRDYTYPVAIPEYEMALSGGADKFKRFLDNELIPMLMEQYKIDINRSAICGHSLGGYFTLFYGLKSLEEKRLVIKNIVSASPSLHYNNRYLFEMEKKSGKPTDDFPLKIYVSMGSEDMADDESKGILDSFEKQIRDRNYKNFKIKKAEYTNFGHVDAAVPGFIKGLTYIFEE